MCEHELDYSCLYTSASIITMSRSPPNGDSKVESVTVIIVRSDKVSLWLPLSFTVNAYKETRDRVHSEGEGRARE